MKVLNLVLMGLTVFNVTVHANVVIDFIDRNAQYQGPDADPSRAGTQSPLARTTGAIRPRPGYVVFSSQNIATIEDRLYSGAVLVRLSNGDYYLYRPSLREPLPQGSNADIIEFPERPLSISEKNVPYQYFVKRSFLKDIGMENADRTEPFVIARQPGRVVYSDGSCKGDNCRAAYMVTCTSEKSGYQFCPIDGLIADPYSYRVMDDPTIEDRLSTAKCKLNDSYGSTPSGVWVDKGCGAKFLVETKRVPRKLTMTCQSSQFKKVYCSLPGIVGMPTVLRQLSSRECIPNKTYWYNEKGIWVKDGCRARFNVRAW